MHRVTVLGLAVLVALSGCTFITGTAEFAPGVSEDRVNNASALATAHHDALTNTSYTFTRTASQYVEGDQYRYSVDHDTRVEVAAGDSFRYRHRSVIVTANGTSRRLDGVWKNRTIAVSRTVDLDEDTVTYTRYRPPEPYSVANVTRSGVSSALRKAVVVDIWNESGLRYARIVSNGSETRRVQTRNGTAVNATTTSQTSAIVRDDGFVPQLEWSIAGQRPLPQSLSSDDELGLINDTTRIRYTDVRSTIVDRPDWVDEALEATEGVAMGEATEPRPAN